jgi:hypothetical protein
MPRLKHLAALPLVLGLWGGPACATASEDASTRIEAGMTIAGVEKAIGFRPNIVEQKTCGGTDNILPWSCRVQTYADGKRTLLIYFSRPDSRSGWGVHSWYVQ